MFETDLFLGPLIATVLIGVSSILIFYWYSTRNLNYWKKRGIRQTKTFPLMGSLFEVFFKPLHLVEVERFRELGTIYGHYEGNKPLLSVAEPDLLRDILVKDFQFFTGRREIITGNAIADKMVSVVRGEDWKRLRTIITPTFTTGKIKRMLSIFKECSQTLVNNFKMRTEQGKTVDAKRIYGAFTMDIIASSAFSTKLDSHNDPDNMFVLKAREAFTRNITWRAVFFLMAPRVMRFFSISFFSPSVMEFFKDATLQIVKERKRTGQVRNDFLQLLMDTVKEVSEEIPVVSELSEKGDITSNYGDQSAEDLIFKTVTSKHMSEDELVAQCVIFFLAGYDTTASTLSFATYLLALNPQAQDTLRVEVDNVISKHGGKLTYEGIQEMKYLDNVISETLRIFPPAIRTERMAEADYTLADTGLTIPKGMVITIPVFAMHKNPDFFPNPDKFDPDRFSPEERAKRDQYTYLPFGAGPRNCVGMRFALMEVKVCLANVIANFIINTCPQTKIPLDYHLGLQGLLQPKEIILKLDIREDNPLKEL